MGCFIGKKGKKYVKINGGIIIEAIKKEGFWNKKDLSYFIYKV
jgi:hypothetical protein